MDLFVVNRYEGEEPVKSENTNNHLSELLKRIEERKQQKAAAAALENEKIVEKHNVKRKVSHKKGKKRKLSKKINDSDQPTENTENQEPSKDSEQADVENVVAPKADQDFMILGSGLRKRKKDVKRVLPRWLAHPEIISAELSSGPYLEDFQKKLDSELIGVLKKNGIEKLFPVQASIIEWLLKCNRDRKIGWWPRDTCVSAPTGSGKTLAYVLPIIQQLQLRFVPKIRCLVVLPVQELAAQVYKVFLAYSAHTNLKIGLISGASAFEAEQTNLVKKSQRGEYSSRVDIVVATPGRLIDHIEKTDGFTLNDLKFLVIDEADRSSDWLQYIPAPHSRAPPLTLGNAFKSQPAQKLLFSATLSQDPEKLSRLGLFQPILFTSVLVSDRDDDVDLDKEIHDFTGRYTSPDELNERAVKCKMEYKPLAVHQLLMSNEIIEKTLIFTNSGETAHRLALLLRSMLTKKKIIVDELSAQLVPKQRANVLERFATGTIDVLVSSDALARGLDIPGVKLVIAYDFPKNIEGYIHRAGRTGRAGIPGTAISVLTPNQTAAFTRMLSGAKKIVPLIEDLDSLEVMAEEINYQEHIDRLKDSLTKRKDEFSERVKASKRKHKTKN